MDHLAKRIYLFTLKETDTAENVAKSFFEKVFKLHGLPETIVSDRDPKLTPHYWCRLDAHCGIELKMPASMDPQTDGATEKMNRTIGNFFRCYCSRHPRDWDELLAPTEFAYNSATL